MADDIDTRGGASVGGNAETGGGDFVNRDKRNENTININVNDKPARSTRQPRSPIRGGLMPDAANEIWRTIAEMRETMGGFRQSVDINSQATKDAQLSIKELTRVVDQSNQRNDSANQKMNEQIAALNRVAKAISGMGIQVPDNGHAEPVIPVRPDPWWKEWVTPALITILIAVFIFFMTTGGRLP